MKTIKDCDFLFIAGVEGSGTTITLKLLETLPGHVCLGGKYISKGLEKPGKKLNKLSRKFWRLPRRSDKRRDKWLAEAADIEVPGEVETIIYKRSYPFSRPRYVPDLLDIQELGKNCKIILVRRHLFDNVNSIIRRGFERTEEKSLNRIFTGYKHLYQQSREVHQQKYPLLIIDYDKLVEPATKIKELSRLSSFLGYGEGGLAQHADMIRTPKTNTDVLQRNT
jgi:hypothetical protein